MRPADDVQSTSAAVTNTAAAASALTFGATGKVGDLTVTVGDVRLNAVITESIGASQRPRASEPGYAWALVHVRVENSTAKEATRPDMMLQCAAGEGRRYAYEGPGALAENPALPARTFAKGDVLFAVPSACTTVTLTATATGAFSGAPPSPVTWGPS